MIGEIYRSKDNHSPITASIFRLKSLRWKLVSILSDCTLQLWLTTHYKVLSGSGRVLSGPSRIWPKYREHAKFVDEILDLTAHLWKRDSPKSWQRMHSLGKKMVFGVEMTEVRDAGLSLKRRGKCGHDPPSPPDPILYTTVRSGCDSKSITKLPDWKYLFLDHCSLIPLASHLVS